MKNKTKAAKQPDAVANEIVANEVTTNEKPNNVEVIDKSLIGLTLIIENGSALKLSPKTENHIFYQIAVDDDGKLFLRLSGNEGGGLHSKEWIAISSITELLDSLENQVIKSNQFKSVFKGGSANNAAFLAAVLRTKDIGLLVKSDKSVFIHKLSDDYEANKDKLLNLKPTDVNPE